MPEKNGQILLTCTAIMNSWKPKKPCRLESAIAQTFDKTNIIHVTFTDNLHKQTPAIAHIKAESNTKASKKTLALCVSNT